MGQFNKEQILILGAIGAAAIFLWSFINWRLSVKVAVIAALLEGAIRKWGLPQAQEIVYFLKDIFLAGAYVRFFLFPEPEVRRVNVNGPTLLVTLVGAIVFLSALNPNIGSIPAAILGLKIYLFYIPMAFMMPFLFKDEKDVVRQLSWFALFAIPICLLGTLQFFSPRFSLLNVYAHEAGSLEQTVHGVQVANVAGFGAAEHARITGTFSFISGMVAYVIVVTGVVFSLLTSPLVRFRVLLIAVVLPLVVANALMSGSRAAVLGQAIVVFAMLFASFAFKTSGKSKGTLLVAVALGITLIAVKFFFRDASVAYAQRTGTEEAREEMMTRIVQTATTLEIGFDSGGWTGLGIGVTHPATTALRSFVGAGHPKIIPPVIESEPAQILMELGVGGFVAWYALRFGLIWLSFTNIRRSPSGFYKNFNAFLFIFQLLHIQFQFVLNHTAQFLFWAMYGISLVPFCTTTHHGRQARRAPLPSSSGTPITSGPQPSSR